MCGTFGEFGVMDIIVLGTSPRPVSYLKSTLASLNASGAMELPRFILADGLTSNDLAATVGGDLDGWIVHQYPGPSGTRLMLWRAFALCAYTRADRLLFFEDDIVLCRNAIKRMQDVAIPDDVGFITYHDMFACPRGSADGLYVLPSKNAVGVSRDFYGTQALVIPRRTCEFLLARDPLEIVKPSVNAYPRNSGDSVMSYLLTLESPWPLYGIHIPCLAEHIGAQSVAWPASSHHGRNKPTNFRGMDFDATGSTLPKRYDWQT